MRFPRVDGPGPIRLLLVAGLFAWLGACQKKAGPAVGPAAQPDVRYVAFAQAYNRRVAAIKQLWSHTVVEIRWVDEKGKKHFEQGDGTLIVRKPDELALAIGRLGNTMYWLGCDAKRYWLFDLKPPEDQVKTAYVGSRDKAPARPLPLPIQPDRLIDLLGIGPLPATLDAKAAWKKQGPHMALSWSRRKIPPASDAAKQKTETLHTRLLFDPQYLRLLEHTVTDDQHRILLEVKLSQYESVELEGRPPGAWPDVPRRFEMTLPTRQVRLTMTLTDKTDNPARIRDVQFQFEQLAQRLKVDQVIDLDQSPAPVE